MGSFEKPQKFKTRRERCYNLLRGVTKLAVPTFLGFSIRTGKIESQELWLLLARCLETDWAGLGSPIHLDIGNKLVQKASGTYTYYIHTHPQMYTHPVNGSTTMQIARPLVRLTSPSLLGNTALKTNPSLDMLCRAVQSNLYIYIYWIYYFTSSKIFQGYPIILLLATLSRRQVTDPL